MSGDQDNGDVSTTQLESHLTEYTGRQIESMKSTCILGRSLFLLRSIMAYTMEHIVACYKLEDKVPYFLD